MGSTAIPYFFQALWLSLGIYLVFAFFYFNLGSDLLKWQRLLVDKFFFCLARSHGAVDKVFDWKVLLSEIIYWLLVQSLQSVIITKNAFYSLTLVHVHG